MSEAASTLEASAISGVMPDPAAIPATCTPSSAPRSIVNVPCGLITSIRSPVRSSLVAQVENAPPRSRLIATLIRPGDGGRQIE